MPVTVCQGAVFLDRSTFNAAGVNFTANEALIFGGAYVHVSSCNTLGVGLLRIQQNAIIAHLAHIHTVWIHSVDAVSSGIKIYHAGPRYK